MEIFFWKIAQKAQSALMNRYKHLGQQKNKIWIFMTMRGYIIHLLGSSVKSAWIGLNCLAGEFYGHGSRISNNLHSEYKRHALSPYKCLVQSTFNFIQNPFNILWKNWGIQSYNKSIYFDVTFKILEYLQYIDFFPEFWINLKEGGLK